MFDVGFTEVLLLSVIGLLVLGPERLPRVARTIGGFVRKARASWVSLRNTIESELAQADLAEPIKKASNELKQMGKDLTDMQGITLSNNSKVEVSERESSPSETPGTDGALHTDSGKDKNA